MSDRFSDEYLPAEDYQDDSSEDEFDPHARQVHRSMPQTMVESAVTHQGPNPAEDRMGLNASVPHPPGMVAVHLPSSSLGPAAMHPQNQPWLPHQPQQQDMSASIGHPLVGGISIGDDSGSEDELDEEAERLQRRADAISAAAENLRCMRPECALDAMMVAPPRLQRQKACMYQEVVQLPCGNCSRMEETIIRY